MVLPLGDNWYEQFINQKKFANHTTREIKSTVIELDLAPNKVKKLLVTAGELVYPETEAIQELLAQEDYEGDTRIVETKPGGDQHLSSM